MHAFEAMNTLVTIAAPALSAGDESLLAGELAAMFAAAEQRFSRFRRESELSQLNRAAGPMTVSTELFEVLVRARAYVEETDGVFDPGVGGALLALGYDRSFMPGVLDRDASVGERTSAASILELRMDAATRTVWRPPHVRIDLGGLVKGRTVDTGATRLPELAGLDAGGDGAFRGRGPDGDGWRVEVEDPQAPDRTLVTLAISDRAVATSAPNRRRWRRGTTSQHHLVDPRTGRASASDLAQVTIIAATAERADVVAKATYLLGEKAGRRFLARRDDVDAVLVRRDGRVIVCGSPEVRDVA